jgi:hypothetical protein
MMVYGYTRLVLGIYVAFSSMSSLICISIWHKKGDYFKVRLAALFLLEKQHVRLSIKALSLRNGYPSRRPEIGW